MEQRQYQLAVTNYQYAIQHFEKHLPFNQQNYALCLSHLGTCYSNMEKNLYDNGINCVLKAVDIYQQNPAENRSNIAQCYWISAFILSKKGKFDEAIQNVYKSLEFRLDEDTINVGLSHNLLGVCYYKKCEYEQSLSSLIISMENYEKHLSDLNNEIGASIFYDIATSLLKLNNYDQALEYAIRSLELREDILPLIDLQKSESHSLLALIYSQKEIQQYEKCNEHCIKALQLSEQVISTGEDIENIGEIYENIAEVCLNVNSLQQARQYYEKALKYMKIDKIDDHLDIHRIQYIIDSLTKTLTET
jgi:tetratricopeptide (TPR) repeat protein